MNALPIKKFFTLLSFLTITIITLPTTSRSESSIPSSSAEDPLALSSLAVPEGLGKVQERFVGNASRMIIQIQDVHAHVVAQQNIAALLERLRGVFGIKTAALEGAWSSTALPKSHALPTSREKQLLAGTLLEKDRISGPVYAAIMSPEPITLVGIEDEASYEKNRALFLAHLKKSEEIEGKLRAYGESLQASQRSLWSPALLAFGNALGKFRETSDLGNFLPVLWEAAQTQSMDTSDLSQITLVRDILSMEKLFQKERLGQEVQHLMREYKNTPWTLEELIRGGKIPAEKLGVYPEIKKLTRLYQLRDQISLQELTDQIETLTDRLLGKIVRSPEEKALWEKTERFYLARRILLLQASPADIKSYESEKSLGEAELASAGLSEALSLSIDFYEVVKKRDEIFFNRVMNDPSLAGNLAIVTGGFHTDGLSQRFRDAGISYITITPELGGTPMNEKLYNARIAEEGQAPFGENKKGTSPQSTTLSELRNAIAWIDDRFPESYEALLQTRDVREAEKVFLGGAAAVSGPARGSHLSRKEKIAPRLNAETATRAVEFRANEFMGKPRLEQFQTVRGWLSEGREPREKAMLVSSASILIRILLEKGAEKLLEDAVSNGDIVALAQDVPVAVLPESLPSLRGIERFEATDIATLVEKTPRFQRLARKRPFAIMENSRNFGAYVILPEKSISLVLFRIITLNPGLYQAAKDPAFLALLENLVTEILSQEAPGKAA